MGAEIRNTEARIASALGASVTGCRVLEIGPGQRKPMMYAFGVGNTYIGVDLELAPDRLTMTEFFRILRENGPLRATKTAGRHLSGIERAYARALEHEFGGKPKGTMLRADAANLPLSADSVDVVVSQSVFEHLPDPAAVMAEIARVLRPGGVAHIVTHLYTSRSGAHDVRLFVDIDALPPWAHLRPRYSAMVRPNTYTNEMRLHEYMAAFDEHWPGACNELQGGDLPAKAELLSQLRAAGELSDYTDEELVSDVLRTVWRKDLKSSGKRPRAPGVIAPGGGQGISAR